MIGRHRKPSPAKGITLLEVVVAAACVAIAVTAISSSMMNSMLSTRQSGEYIARNEIVRAAGAGHHVDYPVDELVLARGIPLHLEILFG